MDFEKQEIRNCIYELQWEMDLEQFVKELQALQSDEFFKWRKIILQRNLENATIIKITITIVQAMKPRTNYYFM